MYSKKIDGFWMESTTLSFIASKDQKFFVGGDGKK